MPVRVGIDSGGTFTDFVCLREDGSLIAHKVPSTPHDPAAAILDGLTALELPQGFVVVHGTTVATNALLERRGAKTALLTTAGFRDVLEIRTLRMPRLYDLAWTKPPPLVERYLRRVVDERIDHNGNVVRLMNHAKPSVWFFTNLDSGASFTLKLPAGVDRITPSADT